MLSFLLSFFGAFLAAFIVMVFATVPYVVLTHFGKGKNTKKPPTGCCDKFSRRKKFTKHGQKDFDAEEDNNDSKS